MADINYSGQASAIISALQQIATQIGSLNQSISTGAASVSTLVPWLTITTSQLATTGQFLLVDTTSAAVTVTLPASPTANQHVYIMDGGGDFSGNNLTIARNGSTIDGAAADLVLSTNGVSGWLVYSGSTWRTSIS